jgi:hypothetical protein
MMQPSGWWSGGGKGSGMYGRTRPNGLTDVLSPGGCRSNDTETPSGIGTSSSLASAGCGAVGDGDCSIEVELVHAEKANAQPRTTTRRFSP